MIIAKKIKQCREAELIALFGLTRLVGNPNSPLLQEWLGTSTSLTEAEQLLFDDIYENAVQNIGGWQEEDLKMKFISFVLRLGHLKDTPKFRTYFEKIISARVGNIFLKTKTDFMVTQGILNMPQIPYFHFQEYKPPT